LVLLQLGGCSSGFYRNWADQQVDQIVRSREQTTLDYQPQVVAPVTVPNKPSADAYAKVPSTPKPPPTTAPIEPSEVTLPYGALGPSMLFPSGVQVPEAQGAEMEEAAARPGERLALGPPSPQAPPVRLDLFGAMRYGVVHSRDYMSQMEDLYLQALDVTLQRHLFDPIPFATTGLHYAGGQENADYAAALTAANTIGVKQKLPYGGQVAAQATVDFVRAISGNASNGESATLALTASIPLLKGAGLINLEPLIQSERDMVYQIRQFEDFRRQFAVNLASSYFNILSAQQSISDRAANYISLQQLTARSHALWAAGRVNYIDVQRALQQQLSAQQDLTSARSNYETQLDDFKLFLGMPVDQRLEIVPQSLSVDVPKFQEKQAAELALRYRLDVQTAQDRVEDARRNVSNARNGLLPSLDLTAQGQVGNTVDRPAVDLNNDTSTYSAGVDLDLPLDRVSERNAYRASLIKLEQAERSYHQTADEAAAAARQSLRSIRNAQISLDIQRKSIDLARLQLENANELLRLGKSDNRNVVDAQNALLQAQEAFEQANASLQIQVLRFLQDTGTLRVDPDAGAIGQAMQRRPLKEVNEISSSR
jgi:outer membrane protein TolC